MFATMSPDFAHCVSTTAIPAILGLPPLMMTCVLGIDFLIELSLSASLLSDRY